MANGSHVARRQQFTGDPMSLAPRVSVPVLVGLTTLAVVTGSLVAYLGALSLAPLTTTIAAGLGALAVVAAAVVALTGHLLLRRRATTHELALIAAASPAHPLLKRLMREAPGTYVHSVAAANLCEAAAEAVGADALLCRVGAYYHDIGKVAQPCFFYENQEEEENPHDMSEPAASARIIMNHVTDGLELGRQYRLPQPVLDIMIQHHGTSLVRYFYHKAAQDDAGVFEADFRYGGRLPANKEAAIVMLADASEAAARAMPHAVPSDVEAAIRGVISEKIADGQLTESGMTFGELDTIAEVFVRQLVTERHVRCQYPRDSRLREKCSCK